MGEISILSFSLHPRFTLIAEIYHHRIGTNRVFTWCLRYRVICLLINHSITTVFVCTHFFFFFLFLFLFRLVLFLFHFLVFLFVCFVLIFFFFLFFFLIDLCLKLEILASRLQSTAAWRGLSGLTRLKAKVS